VIRPCCNFWERREKSGLLGRRYSPVAISALLCPICCPLLPTRFLLLVNPNLISFLDLGVYCWAELLLFLSTCADVFVCLVVNKLSGPWLGCLLATLPGIAVPWYTGALRCQWSEVLPLPYCLNLFFTNTGMPLLSEGLLILSVGLYVWLFSIAGPCFPVLVCYGITCMWTIRLNVGCCLVDAFELWIYNMFGFCCFVWLVSGVGWLNGY
jgi:hypothetical protein